MPASASSPATPPTDAAAPASLRRPEAEPLEAGLMHRVFIATPQQRYRLNVDAAGARRRRRG